MAIREDKILPGEHLVIFDEVQECPEALNSLKYFNEEANEYPEHPLKAFEDLSSFKLFYFDVGLAKCAAAITNEAIILNKDFQFKGALTENYCLQQLRNLFETIPHYYSPIRNYEVDFLLQNGMQIIPVECKAGGNVMSASFKRYRRDEKPELAVRFSPFEYKEQDDMVNVPLYLAGRLKDYVNQAGPGVRGRAESPMPPAG